jgi:hypothetical protein
MAPDDQHHHQPEPEDPDQRERELAEVRRSFTAVGRRLGTLGQQQRFATVTPASTRPTSPHALDDAGQDPGAPAALHLPPVEAPAHRSRWPLAAAALGLALIFAVGLLLGRGIGRDRPTASAAVPVAAQPTVTATTVVKSAVPPSCLSAVDNADHTIDLLVRNLPRDQQFRTKLDAFQTDSRSCRNASPG